MKKNTREKIITYIILLIYIGVMYLIAEKIENTPLKIILMVLSSLIFFVISFLRKVHGMYCVFFNDERLFNTMSVNSDIWYKNDRFCSVADEIRASYEIVDGIKRRVSATNQYYSCCINKGENCPLFQKYSMLSEQELKAFYRTKW